MLIETTHKNKKTKQEIDDLVGKSYGFINSIKMGGTGSKRMIIDEVSHNLKNVLSSVSEINYGNIELRPKGILIHIIKGLQNYTWVIPYYHLVIYKINGASIHAAGKFIHFRDNKTFKENKTFFDKLFIIKTKYDEQYNFQIK